MILKALNEKILILTSLLALCIVLPLEYFREENADREIEARIQELKHGIQVSESRGFSAEEALLDTLSSVAGQVTTRPPERILGGTSFFEIFEIDDFLVRKLQGADEAIKVYPPLNLALRQVERGIALTWSPNPQNEALIQNLEDNPLLTVSYKIYRWTSDGVAQPEVIVTLPYTRNRFLDEGIRPFESRYFYSVLAVFEGTVDQHKTLIESERSNVQSILYEDQFKLKLAGGGKDRVNVTVSIIKDGSPLSHVFSVQEGDEIGGVVEIPGRGQVDFSTLLKVKKILVREVEREEMFNYPVFNADGSRTLDSLTGEPLFNQRLENRMHEVLSIECEDPTGNKRLLEGS